MPAKTKARDVVKNWPRGRSTSAFTGVRYFDSASGFRYRVLMLPWDRQESRTTANPFTDWRQEWMVTPDFRRTVEESLESEYRAGQQAMVEEYRKRTGFAGIVVRSVEFSKFSLCKCGHAEKVHIHEFSSPCAVQVSAYPHKICDCPIFRPTNDVDKFRLAVARAARYGTP